MIDSSLGSFPCLSIFWHQHEQLSDPRLFGFPLCHSILDNGHFLAIIDTVISRHGTYVRGSDESFAVRCSEQSGWRSPLRWPNCGMPFHGLDAANGIADAFYWDTGLARYGAETVGLR